MMTTGVTRRFWYVGLASANIVVASMNIKDHDVDSWH